MRVVFKLKPSFSLLYMPPIVTLTEIAMKVKENEVINRPKRVRAHSTIDQLQLP